jgi:hypothetical protein
MLLKTRTALLTAVALSSATATSATQQTTEAHSHQGFWIGVGFGGGVPGPER